MTADDVLLLWGYLEQISFVLQAVVLVEFVLLGGICALGFFAFWRKLF